MNAVRVEPTPAACSRQQMRLLRCRLRREDEVSNCRLPCSLPREKLYEFVSRVARRRALAWLRETIRAHACHNGTRPTCKLSHTWSHCSSRTSEVLYTRVRGTSRGTCAAASCSTTVHGAARQVQTEGARGAGPDLTRRITTPWQHQRLVRDLSQARAAAV